MIKIKDFMKLEPGTERRVPDLEIYDEFYFGKDFENRFFFSFRGKFNKIENTLSTEAIKINIIEEKSGFLQLRFILLDQILEALFIKVMYNFIDEISKCDDSYSDNDKLLKILTIFNDWKSLLKNARSNKLSDQKIIGLIGELIFLKKLIKATDNILPCFEAWTGPGGGDEDFSWKQTLYEIKATSSAKNNKVTINSLRQLNEKYIKSYLVHVSMSRSDNEDNNSLSLFGICEEISKKIGSDFNVKTLFYDKLLKVGYVHEPRYKTPIFNLDKKTFYHVSETFPVIKTNEVDARVTNVRYDLDLGKCSEFIVDADICLGEL